MIDTDFNDRKRPFAPVHRRSIELQQLDALLRIEELLLRPPVAPVAPVQPAALAALEVPSGLPVGPIEALDASVLNSLIPDAAKAPKRGRR